MSSKEFAKNPWIRTGFLLYGILGASWVLDVGASYGRFRSTRWDVVFGFASGTLLAVFLIAYFVYHSLRTRWLRIRARLGARTRVLGLATGVVVYAITFLLALALLVLVLLQMLGLADPDRPLPIWAVATLLGLLISASIILGLQLPFIDRSVPDIRAAT